MKIQEINIDSLIPYEFNNKKHDENQVNRIANSIKEFWFKNPIVVDKNKIIVNWHWRRLWAKKLWLKTVPCIVADDLTDEQIKKFRILDNRLNESERDLENLQIELSSLKDFNFWDIQLDINKEFDDLFPEDLWNIDNSFWWTDMSDKIWWEYSILLKFQTPEEQQVMYDTLQEMWGFKDIKIL